MISQQRQDRGTVVPGLSGEEKIKERGELRYTARPRPLSPARPLRLMRPTGPRARSRALSFSQGRPRFSPSF
jgi:hypothetical protein